MIKLSSSRVLLDLYSAHYGLETSVTRVDLNLRQLGTLYHTFTTVFQQNYAGNHTITGWPDSVQFVAGQTLNPDPGELTIFHFTTLDGGKNWIVDRQFVENAEPAPPPAGALPVGQVGELQAKASDTEFSGAQVYRSENTVDIYGTDNQQLRVFAYRDESGLNYRANVVGNQVVESDNWYTLGSQTNGTASQNANVAIQFRGNGCLSAQVPDGTVANGNTRGYRSIDLQIDRENATQVAAGGYSVIIGGYANTCGIDRNWDNSAICGGSYNVAVYGSGVVSGDSNAANAEYGFIGAGSGNQINAGWSSITSGSFNQVYSGHAGASFIGSGTFNKVYAGRAGIASGERNEITSSGGHSFIGGGWYNKSSAFFSSVVGGVGANTRMYGCSALASAYRSVIGDLQHNRVIHSGTSTSNTPILLTASRTAPSEMALNIYMLANNQSVAGTISIIARTDAGASASWILHVTAERLASAASTAVLYSNAISSDTARLAGATVSVIANTSIGGILVQATGLAGTTVDWVAYWSMVEIIR